MPAYHRGQRLTVFISSTADLKAERDAVDAELQLLNVDGTRFETWPASPNEPLDECLRCVQESDAVVLMLGQKYGTLTQGGISATHAEYRRALEHGKPLFAFVLDCKDREPKQEDFLAEVRGGHWHSPVLDGVEALRVALRHSLLREFTRCFREVYSLPPDQPPQLLRPEATPRRIELPERSTEVVKLFRRMYFSGREDDIHAAKERVVVQFGDAPEVMSALYMVEVNRGINGREFDGELVKKAAAFWGSLPCANQGHKAGLLYNQGNALTALKRHAEAVTKYEESLALAPESAECWKNLGSAYFSLGRDEEAGTCFEKALALNPRLFEALYCLGTLLVKQGGDLARALDCMNSIDLRPIPPSQQAAVLAWRANICLSLGQYAEGIEQGELAVQADPEQPWSWMHTAKLYAVARGEDKRWLRPAADFWERFLKRFPESDQAASELGFTLWFLRAEAECGHERETLSRRALEAYQVAIEKGEEDGGLLWDRVGHLHEELDEVDEAERAYGEAVARDRPRFLYCLASVLVKQGRSAEALPLAIESGEQHQVDAHGWNLIGKCYFDLRMFEEARTAYEKAIELGPDYPNPWFDLGGLYWNHRFQAEAIAAWEEAVSRFPDHELAQSVQDFLSG